MAELLSAALLIAFALQLSLYKVREWKSDTIMRERERLAHDIHDTMAQSFAGLGYYIQGIRQVVVRSEKQDPEYIAQQLSTAYQLIRRCHSEASQTIAMLGAPSPIIQEDFVDQLAAAALAISGNSIAVETVVTGSLVPMNLRVLDALQHLGKEAIANAISHSGLTHLRLEVNYTSETVELRIVDDGRGFDRALRTTGFGIVGMQKRARDVGGVLTILSEDGIGTEVNVLFNVQRDTWTGRLFKVLRAQLRTLVSNRLQTDR